jgi:hypothetical protein
LNENCMFLLVYVALNALVQFGNWYWIIVIVMASLLLSINCG